jgi:hypothetical protein
MIAAAPHRSHNIPAKVAHSRSTVTRRTAQR